MPSVVQKERLRQRLAQKALTLGVISTFRKSREKAAKKLIDRMFFSVPQDVKDVLALTREDVANIVFCAAATISELDYHTGSIRLCGARHPRRKWSQIRRILPALRRAWKGVVKVKVKRTLRGYHAPSVRISFEIL